MRTADGYIISKCLNDGDSTAFGLLVDKYKASIYALAYSKLHNFHDAEDVTQEVFVKAYRNLRKLRRWDNFFAWLYSITSNLCKDLLQERAKFSDSEFIEDQSVDMLKTASIRSFHDEMAFESIREALDSLPEIYQQVLTLHYLGGMTGEEISVFLGVPHPTIRQRLSRARSMLKEGMLTWSQLNDIPPDFAMAASTSVVYNDDIYIFGGLNPTNGQAITNIIVYHTKDETWKKMKSSVVRRAYGVTAIINDKAYYIGGDDRWQDWIPVSNVEEYDIKTDTISEKLDMPNPRGYISGCVLGNKIYVVGGLTGWNGDVPIISPLNEVYTSDNIDHKSVDPSGKLPKTWGMLKAK